MVKPEIFALRDSSLNAFLFADVGTELNGSRLTILSLLARLDSDPWTEAAQWASLPRSTAADWLAARIECMPLTPQSLAKAPETAARLVRLLPRSASANRPADTAFHRWTERWWVPLALAGFILAIGLAISMILVPHLASGLVQSNPYGAVAAP